jgi:uncharacterized protein (DUF433 family)
MFLAMLDCTQCAVVERVPAKVSGAWVFKATRVPVRALFENLEDGATVNEFPAWFPCVTREPVGGRAGTRRTHPDGYLSAQRVAAARGYNEKVGSKAPKATIKPPQGLLIAN